ncbi:transcriptional regulator [Pseudonocardia sp. GCM10023141]|uniref:transcriptional regulator n=1 Tax=Pseudonocardia sp. GCM10023141 TaxID=3252653 RepID=UPI0036096EFF
MEVVDSWTGQRACALQQALRLTNEGFAAKLGTAVRTVAKWSQRPAIVPTSELQQALDVVLEQAGSSGQARFGMLLRRAEGGVEPDTAVAVQVEAPADEAETRLAAIRQLGPQLEWLDTRAGWETGTGRRRVAAEASSVDLRSIQDRGHRRARVHRLDVARALREYYAPDGAGLQHGAFVALHSDSRTSTSVLTCPQWLDLRAPLNHEGDLLTLDSERIERDVDVHEHTAAAAVRRLAEGMAIGGRMTDAPIYRLLDHADITQGAVQATLGLSTFVTYALTMDLLEAELVDALVSGAPTTPGHLPIRDTLLPDAASVLNVRDRLCAGGALALMAIARPADHRRREPDYVLLVQERSGQVLNASRRLAVIPKGFHQPSVDYAGDVLLGETLRREMEEELFGREDVDSTIDGFRHADPMHRSRLSRPMRWLTDHPSPEHWAMECTGFGLNLVSGNFEFAGIIAIHDDQFWTEFGGDIAANWESSGLRQYSSRDRAGLTQLINDPAWSNEGLFALLQGLRRLAEIGDDRVDVPTIEWEIA